MRMTILQQSGSARIAPRWAITPGRVSVAPTSVDAGLTAQFEARVQRLFALLDAVLAAPPTPAAIGDLRDALHKVAGTAAFFEHAGLGRAAADLDEQLGDFSAATPDFLDAARVALRSAAGRP